MLDWVLLNCAPVLLSLNSLPSAGLAASGSALHFWGLCVLGPFLGTQRAQAVQCLTLQ